MPMNRADYHPDWESISRQIREQANWQCEFCGIEQGERTRSGGKVVLTVAHLNHDTRDNEPSNLRALCQRCHLRWDAKHHQRNAAETRRQKRIQLGQRAMEAA